MVFNIQRTFALSDAELGLVLALAIAVAGASSAVMAHLADRVGARRLLWIALFAWSVLLVVMSAVQQRWAFVGALVAGRDRRRQHRHRHERRGIAPPDRATRPDSSGSTPSSTCGAIVGAAAAGIVLHAGVSWRWVWPGVAVVALVVGVWTLHHRHRPGASGDAGAGRPRATGCTRSSASAATASSSCWPSSPWPRSPRAASTPGACSICAITWPRACCSAPGPTSSARSWRPRPAARAASWSGGSRPAGA